MTHWMAQLTIDELTTLVEDTLEQLTRIQNWLGQGRVMEKGRKVAPREYLRQRESKLNELVEVQRRYRELKRELTTRLRKEHRQ